MTTKAETKKSSKSLAISPRRLRVYLVFIGVLFLGLLILGLSLNRYALWQKGVRENQRVEMMNKIVTELEKFKAENEDYPEAVFFKTDSVLICPKIDCLISTELELKGSTKGASDLQPKTDKEFTSYKYELSDNTFKLAFCDEDGQVNNFGEASYDEMICK